MIPGNGWLVGFRDDGGVFWNSPVQNGANLGEGAAAAKRTEFVVSLLFAVDWMAASGVRGEKQIWR
jgi:hypothetical protein